MAAASAARRERSANRGVNAGELGEPSGRGFDSRCVTRIARDQRADGRGGVGVCSPPSPSSRRSSSLRSTFSSDEATTTTGTSAPRAAALESNASIGSTGVGGVGDGVRAPNPGVVDPPASFVVTGGAGVAGSSSSSRRGRGDRGGEPPTVASSSPLRSPPLGVASAGLHPPSPPAAMSSFMSSLARDAANVSVAGDDASVAYRASCRTFVSSDACTRSAS